jgi:hypothetical protein
MCSTLGQTKDLSVETTIIARRFAILFLTVALFAIGFWTIVDRHARPNAMGHYDLTACSQMNVVTCRGSL